MHKQESLPRPFQFIYFLERLFPSYHGLVQFREMFMEDIFTHVRAKLKASVSIPDVIVILFQIFSSEKEQEHLSQYNHWLEQGKNTEQICLDLDHVVQLMCRDEEDLQAYLEELLHIYKSNAADIYPLIAETLFCFDNEHANPQISRSMRCKTKISRGPLNTADCQGAERAYLYAGVKRQFQQPLTKSYSLRRGRNILSPHPSGLRLKNYIVVKSDQLNGMIPRVWAYYPNENDHKALQGRKLKIAVIPFANQMWFNFPLTSGGREFDIVYTPELEEKIKAGYVQSIRCADAQGADIVLFPEMALGSSALQAVKDHLMNNGHLYQHIKLIFAGTKWKERENTAHILTQFGDELLSQKKREPFEYYDKGKKKMLREHLKDHDNQLYFLDIDGLGRISYSVCRDFLDPQEALIRGGLMQSNFFFASCYTGSIDSFLTSAQTLITNYAAIVLVCNSCAPVKAKQGGEDLPDIGFIAVPTAANKRLGDKTEIYDPVTPDCMAYDCGLCHCLYIYTLCLTEGNSPRFLLDHEKISLR